MYAALISTYSMHFPAWQLPLLAEVVKQCGTHVILAIPPRSFLPSLSSSFVLSGCCADVNCSIYLHFQFTAPILSPIRFWPYMFECTGCSLGLCLLKLIGWHRSQTMTQNKHGASLSLTLLMILYQSCVIDWLWHVVTGVKFHKTTLLKNIEQNRDDSRGLDI